ncbi:MAG: hypothetical protein DHS20C07_11660 [Methyloligella sp.]|nr:MAG: hypothetical protein DHS20C07_11660 [Methyloligella sp.]
MNREETLALYEQGVEAWNKWANEMLEEKKRLEEAGEWKVYKSFIDSMCPCNEPTKQWLLNASADFSNEESTNVFYKKVDFSNFIFPADVDFSMAKFINSADFNKTTFYNFVNFENCKFMSWVNFDHSIFYEPAYFKKIKCYKSASFEHVECHSFFHCDNSTFKKISFFGFSKYNFSTIFDNTVFLDSITFSGSHFSGYLSFAKAKFNKVAEFNAISSKGTFNLENTFFKNQAPNFIQASFKEAPRLDNIKIGLDVAPGSFLNSITTFINPEIKASYQALKRLAMQAHDHESEQRFWAGELRSDRSLRTEDGGWNFRPLVSAFWWGNIAYSWVSDYGRSIVRPIGALLILICLMTGLHLTKSKTPLTYDQAFSAGYIAANKSFLYLGTDPTKRSIIKEKYSALYGANENQTPKIPKTILTAEFFQTLFSAIFIFLALLGIRNNFKMK